MNFFCILIKLVFFSFLSYSLVFADQKMADNFNNNPEQRWMFFADTVMGGRSSGDVVFNKSSNNNYAHLSGIVTTENNGGFIQMRTLMAPKIDTDKYQGIYLKVYGNNKYYSIHLRTRYTIAPWQYYSFEFFASKEWVEIKAPFKEFSKSNFYQPKKLENQEVNSIGLIAGFENFMANICMAEIGLY